MESSTMNTHEISHFTVDSETSLWHSGRPETIGSALDPTLVLFNHSCDPNVIRINLGKATIVYATRDIKEDKEVRNYFFFKKTLIYFPTDQ